MRMTNGTVSPAIESARVPSVPEAPPQAISGEGRPPRSTLDALGVLAGIRAKHALLTWFYLKPFLCRDLREAHPRSFPTHAAPDIADAEYLCLKVQWLVASFFQQNQPLRLAYFFGGALHLNHLAFWPIEERLVREAARRGPPSPQSIPIPEFDWRRRSPAEFVEEFVQKPFPVLLRGFSADHPAARAFRFEEIMMRYGDDTVLLTTREKDGFEGKLSQVRDPKVYLHNSETLFRQHPELKAELGMERFIPYSGGKREAYSQIFVGRQGTGSPFHCAPVWNWFHMLDGKKRWSFVDPNHSPYIYPLCVMGRAAATAHVSYPDEYNREAYPLFAYCPLYHVDLGPGDVLMVPPWWWHCVQNRSDTSVAVANRMHTGGVVGEDLLFTEENYDVNRFLSVMAQIGFQSPIDMFRLCVTPSPAFDERTTLRERNNRYVDMHFRLSSRKVGGIFHKL
jgi:hypothetical protein